MSGALIWRMFYAGEFIGDYSAADRRAVVIGNQDLYNGAYLYALSSHNWYRCDLTPVLIEDVPKELRLLALLMS